MKGVGFKVVPRQLHDYARMFVDNVMADFISLLGDKQSSMRTRYHACICI